MHTENGSEIGKLRAQLNVFYVTLLHYKLTRNSRGSYSIITSPWPRVLAGVQYKASLIYATFMLMRGLDEEKHHLIAR